MKKFLLSMAAVAMGMTAHAEIVAYVAQGATYNGAGTKVELPTGNIAGNTYSAEGVCSFQITKVNSSTSQVNGGQVRWYANDVLILTPAEGVTINSVTFSCTSSWGAITCNGTQQTPSASNKIITFNNIDKAEAIQITHSAQNRFDYLEVDYTAGNSDLKPADLSFDQSKVTVLSGKSYFDQPTFSNPNSLEVTWSSSNESVAVVDETGKVTVKGVGTTEIIASSEETEEYKAGEAHYVLEVIRTATSITQMKQYAPNKGDEIYVDRDLYVAYVNGSYVYVEDYLLNGTLIYQTNNLAKGDVIPRGWVATNATYNGLIEWTGTLPEVTEHNGETYPETLAEVTEDDVNRIVNLKTVKFTSATPSTKTAFKGDLNGTEVEFYNQWEVASVEAGTYKVLCAISYRTSNGIQIFPIEYVKIDENADTNPVFTVDNGVISAEYADDEEYGEIWKVDVKTPETSAVIKIAAPEGYTEVYCQEAYWNINPMTIPVNDTMNVNADGEAYMYMIGFGNNGERDMDTFSLVSVTATHDETVAVEGIEAVSEAAYFTLDGVKVANPEKGVFIKIANGKATKVVL